MKVLNSAEAKSKFSECLKQSGKNNVILLDNGNVTAFIFGMKDAHDEKNTEDDLELSRLLAEREHTKRVPWKEVRQRLLDGLKKEAAG